MLKLLSAGLITLTLAACGGGGGDSKDLFSLWTRDGDNAQLDLTGSGFGTNNYIALFTPDATRCICNLAIIGTQDSGSFAVTGCISSPYNSRRQPSCEANNGVGPYSKTSDILTITRDGRTATFR